MLKYLLCLFLFSCAWQTHYPEYPLTATVAAKSTYKITIMDSEGEDLGYGTAWIAGIQDNDTYIVTAGHVCNAGLTNTYKIMDKDDHYFDVQKRMSSEDPDLCLLVHHGILGKPLFIDWKDPVYGDWVGYVGAPAATFGHGLAPYYHGNFIGDHFISAPTAPGASGSAIWSADGVIGVLVNVNRRFDAIVGFVPRQDLINFLSLAGFHFGNVTYPKLINEPNT